MMTWRPATGVDLETLVQLNRLLQIEEGASVMAIQALRERLTRWLEGHYQAVMFEQAANTVVYALYRETDPDLEGRGGIYLRQFFVQSELRRKGYGGEAFRLLSNEIWPRRTRIILEALASNPTGQAFWTSLGFTPYSVTYERVIPLTL